MKNFIKSIALLLILLWTLLTATTHAAKVKSWTVSGVDTLTVCGYDYNSQTSWCITMMDRNLWATSNDISDTWSYWNYYQRWNNYWFPYDGTITTWNQQIVCSSYGPLNPFSGSTFIVWNTDYCQARNRNMWWWGSDNNALVYPVNNPTQRQWPCPTWYHVPSEWEWAALLDMWAWTDTNWDNNNNSGDEIFRNDFKIPFAGLRNFADGSFVDCGISTHLWSSSHSVGNERVWSLLIYGNHAQLNRYYMAYAFPVRCFKDSPIVFSGWSEMLQFSVIIDGEVTIWLSWTAGLSGMNIGSVGISNNDQILTGSFGANSFRVEDMKWAPSGYYTTLSITDLSWDVAPHMISKSNIRLKPTGVSLISGAAVNDSLVVMWANNTRNNWMTWDAVLTYFNRQNTPVNNAGRVWRYWDNLQIKVNVPAHTAADTYRATITYTLYEL